MVVFNKPDDGYNFQTNFLIAIQSKIYEYNYKRGENFSREQFLMSYAKAMMRVLLRVARQTEFKLEQGKQVTTDFTFICDLFIDSIDKEEEGIVHGFYQGIIKGIQENCEGDCTIKSDRLSNACSRKRGGVVKFTN